MMLNVGILGATGFIGTRTTEFFCVNKLAEIKPIVRASSSLSHLKHLGLKSCIADALDSSSLYNAFVGCDIVIYCISGNPWFLKKTVASTYQAAEKAKVRRLVYLSTASVHGQAPLVGTDENSPLNESQFLAYNNAKVKAEKLLLKLRQKRNTEIVILRPGIVTGPYSSWVAGFANSLQNQTAYLVNQGQGICNSIYIDNLAHAIYLAMITPDVDQEAFIVGDRERITWADLYDPIAQALGKSLSQVPNINCSDYNPSLKEYLREAIQNSDLLGELIHLLKPVRSSKKTRQVPQQSALNQEMAWLYQCQYQLPDQKAEELLNYTPIISFHRGCEYMTEWLKTQDYLFKV
ncbi:MAG: NAD(P)H-binding protein [Cyanobacteria bacterium J06592_8]